MGILMPLGWPEILIVLLIIVVLFGARRIPELAKGLGEGIRNFKTGLHTDERKEERRIADKPEPREETQRT